jgi:DeoR/GlpR family transcriptional regulator of sugar metabolism
VVEEAVEAGTVQVQQSGSSIMLDAGSSTLKAASYLKVTKTHVE